MSAVERLRGLGIEVSTDGQRVLLNYPTRPPEEARAVIGDLTAEVRRDKPAVIAALCVWDQAREMERLSSAFTSADAEARRQGVRWGDAWAAAPPELRAFMDAALDSIDAAFRAQDVVSHSAALAEFRRVVSTIAGAHALDPGHRPGVSEGEGDPNSWGLTAGTRQGPNFFAVRIGRKKCNRREDHE